MEEQNEGMGPGLPVRDMIREVIQQFVTQEHAKSEPAYRTELLEERKKREALERRVNELVDENQRARQVADELDRSATIRSELQRLGVAKVDLAFKAVRDDVRRSDDGRLVARMGDQHVELPDYLRKFVQENPELLPARGVSGAGTTGGAKTPSAAPPIDLDRIKPGMSADELDRVRQEIVRLAKQEQ